MKIITPGYIIILLLLGLVSIALTQLSAYEPPDVEQKRWSNQLVIDTRQWNDIKMEVHDFRLHQITDHHTGREYLVAVNANGIAIVNSRP